MIFALAAPPTNAYPALWLGMAGLAFVLDEPEVRVQSGRWARLGRWLAGAGPGLAFGAGANLVALRFVPDTIVRFTPLPWAAGVLALALLSLAQGLRWVATGVVHRTLARRGVPTWLAFGAGAYASTFVPAVFPWNPAGGVTPWPEMVQLADLVGERGVTLLMAFSGALLAAAVRVHLQASDAASRRARLRVRRSYLAAALALPVLTYVHGRLRIAHVEADRASAATVAVGLVQPSTGPRERWDPDKAESIVQRLTNLTRTSEKQGAELTVWPEAAYPLSVGHASRYCPVGAYALLPMGVRGPVLAGFVMTGDDGDLYNSAAVCRTNGTMSRPYDKLRLLAFGEKVPLIGRIPWVRRTFSHGTGLVPGAGNVVQTSGAVRASVLNCFEDTLPEAGIDAMADRPNLLVNVTNDAWFTGSAESELHLRLAVLRAVESRRDLVRAVNLGPTTWVDAAGVIRGRYDSPLAGVLMAKPALLEWSPTLYDRAGDLPTLLLVVLASALARQKSEGRRDAAAPSSRPGDEPPPGTAPTG